ncbi:MAG: dTDP-4-dehydrorhamnose reductase [Candidatus Marinimicrobia bacterium]|nr:dTDP-4-dehydrorhamnose reductase [Candidatus Neomarinimicrobiota bacterium]
MPDRILITGAAGQLGSALCAALESEYDLLRTDIATGPSADIALDITSAHQVDRLFSDHQPAVVINTAAFTDVDGNDREPETAQKINLLGVEHLVGAAARSGARVIQISTDYVFDGSNGPYLETDPVNPQSVYGHTKLAAEKITLAQGKNLVIRTNVLFGPDLTARASFVRWVVESLQADETIRVVDDQINNPTLTIHMADAIKIAVEREAAGLMHYGGLEFASRYQFARQIGEHFQLPLDNILPIATVELKQLAPRPLNGGLICSRMKMELGVENYNIRAALQAAFPVN